MTDQLVVIKLKSKKLINEIGQLNSINSSFKIHDFRVEK